MNGERISVVVPVYQVRQWLDRCLASVQEQTHNNLEIILVNDGSTDGSGGRCDELAAEDARIRVVHQSNKGLSAARNRGLEIATGDWITFIDSDDWVHPEMLERLLTMTGPEVDIAVAGFERVTTIDSPQGAQCGPTELLTSNQVLARYFGADRTLLTIACAKLFRREMFTEIRFPEGRLHEDEATTYKLLAKAKLVALTRERLYYYFSNPDSITGSGLSPRHRLDIVRAASERQEFFQKHGPPQFDTAARVDLARKLIQLHQSYVDAGERTLAQDALAKIRVTSRLIPIKSRPLAALFTRAYSVMPTWLSGLQRARLTLLRALSRAHPRSS